MYTYDYGIGKFYYVWCSALLKNSVFVCSPRRLKIIFCLILPIMVLMDYEPWLLMQHLSLYYYYIIIIVLFALLLVFVYYY